MGDEVLEAFKYFQDDLNYEENLREDIRAIVKDLEKSARGISIVLQNIHNDTVAEENIIVSEYCSKARELFEDVRAYYVKLALVVPKGQYFRFHEQWRYVTQKLCFLAALVVFLEVKILVSKDTVAEMLGIPNISVYGVHLNLEDFLIGLLKLPDELTRFAINSVTNGDYNCPIEIAKFINELDGAFKLLSLKNDTLRKRFDGLKYSVKKIEEVVYDLSIRGLKPDNQPTPDYSD